LRIVSSVIRRLGLGAAMLVSLFLVAACSSGPTDPTWASLSLTSDSQNVFLAFGDRVVLIDPVDGSEVKLKTAAGQVRLDDQGNPRLWELKSPDSTALHFYAAPIFTDQNVLLVPSYDKKLLTADFSAARIDDPTGVALDGHIVADIAATDKMLYVPLRENSVVAYNRSDMSVAWKFDTEHGVWAKPLVEDNVVYLASLDHFLYAVDATTGQLVWKTDLQGALTSTPAYVDGHLYIGSLGRKIFDVSASDGSILAQYDAHDWVWGTPAVQDNVLYVGDMAGYLYALNVGGDGFTEKWVVQAATRPIRATPVLTDKAVIIGSRDNNLYWLSRDNGSTTFSRQMHGEVLSDMLVIGPEQNANLTDHLLLVSTMASSELLVAFTLDNGERRWAYGR
jgi:outer membrane protein assembly factor BamB